MSWEMLEKPSKAEFFTKVQRTPKHVLAVFGSISGNWFADFLSSMSWQMLEKSFQSRLCHEGIAHPKTRFGWFLAASVKIDLQTFFRPWLEIKNVPQNLCHFDLDFDKGKKCFASVSEVEENESFLSNTFFCICKSCASHVSLGNCEKKDILHLWKW